MAELRQNTWTLNQWYDQDVAGDAKYAAAGKLWAWGYNLYGQLGQNQSGPTASYSSPIQIGTDTNWSKVANNGYNNMFGMKQDGSLWAWGRNSTYIGGGSLGLNDAIDRSSPTQLPGTGWQMTRDTFNSGYGATSAIKENGSLWIWGSNQEAQLGLPRVAPYWYYLLEYSSPVQLPGNYSKTRYGSRLSTGGALSMWGANQFGECGQNTGPTTPMGAYSSPVQIPGTWSDFMRTNNAPYQSCSGIKSDGTLWAWGYGGEGALGLNDRSYRSSPTQVPGTWLRCASGNQGVYQAWQKPDGSIWFAGGSTSPYINFGYPGKRSSPTQVPGTMIPSISHFVIGGQGLFLDVPNSKNYVTGPNGQGKQGNNTTPGGYADVTYVPSVWDKFKDSGMGIDQIGNANSDSNFAIEQQ
tara:strand:- start:342 stop:1571 length:1230 start_codon:yes stop_codon:yes gene_type:complete